MSTLVSRTRSGRGGAAGLVATLLLGACSGSIDGGGTTPSAGGKTPNAAMPNGGVEGPDGTPGSSMLPPVAPPASNNNTPPPAPQPPPVVNTAPTNCAGKPATTVRSRVYLLDGTQYALTLATVFQGRSAGGNADLSPPSSIPTPLADFDQTGNFSTSILSHQMNADRTEAVLQSADAASTKLVADKSVKPCATGTDPLKTCLTNLVQTKGELLFRRPLTTDEVARYVDMGTNLEPMTGRNEAVRQALKAMLVAPQFLFRSEMGQANGNTARLTPFEIASAISYALTDGPPDQPLWTDAVSGMLADKAVIAKHVARLLESPKTGGVTARIFRELFDYEGTVDIAHSDGKFKPRDTIDQADELVKQTVLKSLHKDFIKQLLTGQTGYATSDTAPYYNAMVPKNTNKPVEVTYTGDRFGLLGHPAWLSSYAQPERSDPVRRGAYIQERLLCGHVPNAPIGVVTALSTDPKITLREKLVAHRTDPGCAACHQMMDGIGIGLEAFDQQGKMRDLEAGKPVIKSAALIGSGEQDGPFEGLAGLSTKLSASETVVRCMASQTLEYFTGRAAVDQDACTIEQARVAYRNAGGDFTALVQALLTSDAFLTRSRI